MKANRLSFSIVICTLNNISALKKCIESIINQTLKANEVIVVHGGDRSSTLKYIEVINKLNNTNYIYLKKQKSLVRQRNAGIKHASSDVIFFIDDDAILDSDYFEIIMDFYTKYWETNLGGVQGTIWQHKQMKININTWFRKFFLNSVLNGTGKQAGLKLPKNY